MQKKFFTGIVLGIVLFALLGGTQQVFAQEGQESTGSTGAQDTAVSETEPVSEEVDAESLRQIAAQLKQIEAEVTRLSLLVSKVVLERQALVLQEQLAGKLASEEQDGFVEAPREIAVQTPLVESQETQEQKAVEGEAGQEEKIAVNTEPETAEAEEVTAEPEPEAEAVASDVFRNLSLQSDEEEGLALGAVTEDGEDNGQEGGFFAGIQNAFGNLRTPEIVTLLILGVLIVFVVLRRLTGSKRKKMASAPAQSVSQQQTPGGGQKALDEQRQELQERVAWK